ncbi:serine hydrolase FSH [Biscogniauxia mediterranea]|nr:serine hydrolase FSH [Biscogniauxia mediterranea]
MKVLCLHGQNQSGRIFKNAIESIPLDHQDSSVNLEFEFLDGPLRCADHAANGEPLYRYYETLDIPEIRKAHQWLGAKLHEGGPYDGVVAFSQGAALVSSYLLYHQWYNHESPPPFRLAMFIGGSIPLQVLKDLGVPVSKEAERVVEEAKYQRHRALGPLPAHSSKARRAVFNSDDCFGLNLNSIPLELKIRIPTIHVWGKEDPLLPASIHLVGFCDPYIRKIHIHEGAHEVPETKDDRIELGQLLQWGLQRAVWPGHDEV